MFLSYQVTILRPVHIKECWESIPLRVDSLALNTKSQHQRSGVDSTRRK